MHRILLAALLGLLPLSSSQRRDPWPDADWRVLDAKVRWAVAQRLDTLPIGTAIARLGETFVGTTYTPGTLEAPGPEHVVINLRELDCVPFGETWRARTGFTGEGGVADDPRHRQHVLDEGDAV